MIRRRRARGRLARVPTNGMAPAWRGSLMPAIIGSADPIVASRRRRDQDRCDRATRCARQRHAMRERPGAGDGIQTLDPNLGKVPDEPAPGVSDSPP